MVKDENFEITTQNVLDTMNKILALTEENDIHPLIVMAACPVVEEYIALRVGVSKREIDMSRRGAHRLVRALTKTKPQNRNTEKTDSTHNKG
jgi:hypothetical protein